MQCLKSIQSLPFHMFPEQMFFSESSPSPASPENLVILELTDHSFTIEWQAVKNATHYRWNCDSSDQSTGGLRPDTRFSFDRLKPGTPYHFKVRAEDNTRTRPVDGGDYPFYSDWTELDFTTPEITE